MEKDFSLMSEKARRLVGRMPSALAWWGMALSLGVVALALAVLFFVKIPVKTDAQKQSVYELVRKRG